MRQRKIPVACVQTDAFDREDFERAWPAVVDDLRAAARTGAALIVLPEATVPGYFLGTEPIAAGQIERAAADVADVARAYGTTIVYGTARVEAGRTYNSAVVVGPDGAELGRADKHFLWHFDRRWFAPGATIAPVATPAGVLGILVCADGRIPTLSRTLVERGAEVLVMSTAWVTSGRDPAALENIQADLMINVRARENGVPFVAANKCGTERGSVAYCGKSAIVDADGTVAARAPQDRPALIVAEVELGRAPLHHERAFPADLQLRAGSRARVAFTAERDPVLLTRFERDASLADAALLAPGDFAHRIGEVVEVAGVRGGAVDDAMVANPAGLVAARLAGLDVFFWSSGMRDPVRTALARTRSAELRAYLVVVPDDPAGRAFVADPDGVVTAGTFDGYRVATFVYEPARSAATAVAPHTDVLEGLRSVERARNEALGASRG